MVTIYFGTESVIWS